MTLREMAVEYRRSAAALRERILLLEEQAKHCADERERQALLLRADDLAVIHRETRSIALYMERYYRREGREKHEQNTKSTDHAEKQ